MGWFKSPRKIAPKGPNPTGRRSPRQAVRVSDHLSDKAIRFFPAGVSLQRLFEEMIRSLDLPDPETALKAVLEREESGTTVIAPGLAIPHARLLGLSGIVAALGLCPDGVPCPSGEPIRLVVLFLSPKDKMREHLMFLAAVSSLLQTEGVIPSLLQSTESQAVLKKIREVENAP